MRNASSLAVALIVLASPLISSALTEAELRAQAEALLLQVQALQTQLATQGGASVSTPTNATTGAASNNSALCPALGRTLKRGSSGDDVTRLQQFLAQDPAIYPEGTVSGYFGALTEAAVQRWQAKFKIVSSGNPSTTGYGVVGPRTAAAIAIVCSGGSYNGISGGGVIDTSAPVGGFIQVTPISGTMPLQVSVQATINTTQSCAAALYTLDYGDGSAPQQIPSNAGSCAPQTVTFTHTYAFAGTFKITLAAGGHSTNATVTVLGGATTNPNPNPTAGQTTIPMTDNAFTPKSITIAPGTKVTWVNNGAMVHNVVADNKSFQSGALQPGQSYSQTFTLVGSYPYYCSLHGAAGGVGMAGTITVANSGSNTTNETDPGPIGVTPGSSGNPLAVSLQFPINNCNYSINWGDGKIEPAPSNCTAPATKSLTHTYTQGGSYTIAVTRAGKTETAGVVISQ